MGTSNVSVKDLMNLKNGDIITLNTKIKDDIEIFVEEEVKFYGRPGFVGKFRGVEIISRVYSEGIEEE